ncbi:AGAP006143-PD-like protein [Anopheles sinensis]|uniref:AGAP006143-PD-like protein n=1 Tax=Anopheles sinensis TaxID=74873 RepID=A0A084WEQ2_ANOSI|nr:AGAP006143-PD-like protein [Anopheles sinensis]
MLQQILEDIHQLRKNVLGMVTLMLYTTLALVMVPIILWPFFYNRNLEELTNRLLEINYVIRFDTTTSKCADFLLLKVHIACALATLLMDLCVNCYSLVIAPELPPMHHIVVANGFPVLVFIIAIHQGYTQLWPVFIVRQLKELVRQVTAYRLETLLTIIALSNTVEELTELFASIFGPMQVVNLLRIFVICCVQTYYLFVVEAGIGIFAIVIELIVYIGSFFIYMYLFDNRIKKVSKMSEKYVTSCLFIVLDE